jgi:hypothetical protein
VVEGQGADPQGGGERQHHGGDQQQRRHDGAQHQAEDDQHHRKDQRHHLVAVVAGGTLDVEVDGAAAADLGVRPRDGVHPGAELVHGGKARLTVGAAGQRPFQVGVAVPDHRAGDGGDPRGAGHGGLDLRRGLGLADHLDRVALAGGEVAGQHRLAGHRLGRGAEGVLALQAVGLQPGHP